jgi:hypothetical protein
MLMSMFAEEFLAQMECQRGDSSSLVGLPLCSVHYTEQLTQVGTSVGTGLIDFPEKTML